ncbi:MAG TPA: hypothetical protein ENK71_01530 [Epsilonproteobacteria bacterium]|nr:hypothetical protein [Campylobacterota bacterium]
MFIIEPIRKAEATGELKLLYRMIERTLGYIPPHFELFATIDIEAMKEFLNYNVKMTTHPKIDKNLMPYLRFMIASKECRRYCTDFNTKMIRDLGHEPVMAEDIASIPFDEGQKRLLSTVMKALYESEAFDAKDIAALEAMGFSHKDLYDLLSYATGFIGKSKMIEAYLQ